VSTGRLLTTIVVAVVASVLSHFIIKMVDERWLKAAVKKP